MQHSFKLGRVVQVGFGSVFMIMVGIGFVSKVTTSKLITANGWVSHTYRVEASLEDIANLLVDAETGQRGYLLTGKNNFLEPYNAAKASFDRSFADLEELIRDDPEQVARLRQVRQSAEDKMENMAATIELAQQGKRDQAVSEVSTGTGKRLMDKVRARLAEMVQVEEQLLAEREKTASDAAALANLVSIGGTSLAIAFGLAVLGFISREIVRPINQVASAIASSSNEIAATVEQQERTASQQAASVNETTTTMDQLSSSAQQSAQQAESATVGAQQVLALANQGNSAVERSLQNMGMLSTKVSAVADQIVRLSEQTNQIGNISALVSDLANQTNMLALNAAVEAVRAGEQGKGFAVVAAEIRKLADESKRSAEKINSLVSDIQSAINSTVMVTDDSTKTAEQGAQVTQQTAEVFSHVTEAINSVVLSIQQISLNAKQQATAVQQVVQAMNMLNVAARDTASGISQTRSSTHQLNEAARKLQSVV